MCRLVALVNFEDNLSKHESDKIANIFTHLFYLNSFGNTDGSGIMSMSNKGSVWGHKRAIPSPDFIATKWYKGFKNGLSDQTFVAGHTRYSTVGGNSDENSHPFSWGNFVLMQNGTATVHKTLVPGKTSPCPVDSESVCWAISQQGVDKTFEKYEGDGAFIFIDRESKTFNIVKNDERDLHIAKVKDRDIWLIATEMDSLMYSFAKFGVDIDSYMPDGIENGLLHTWNLEGEYSTRILEVKPRFQSYYQRNNYGYKKNHHSNSKTHTNNQPQKQLPVKGAQKPVGKSSESTEQQYNSSFEDDELPFGQEQFSLEVHDCSLCSSPISADEPMYEMVEYSNSYCCEDCKGVALELGHRLYKQGVSYVTG